MEREEANREAPLHASQPGNAGSGAPTGAVVLEQFPPLCLWRTRAGGSGRDVSTGWRARKAPGEEVESHTCEHVWGTPIPGALWALRRWRADSVLSQTIVGWATRPVNHGPYAPYLP